MFGRLLQIINPCSSAVNRYNILVHIFCCEWSNHWKTIVSELPKYTVLTKYIVKFSNIIFIISCYLYIRNSLQREAHTILHFESGVYCDHGSCYWIVSPLGKFYCWLRSDDVLSSSPGCFRFPIWPRKSAALKI